MPLLSLILLSLLALATSWLLVGRGTLAAGRTVTGIGVLIFWLCLLILPVQALALLDIAGVLSPVRLSSLLLLHGVAFACAGAVWLHGREAAPEIPRSKAKARPGRVTIPWHVRAGLFLAICVYVILAARMACSFPNSWDAVAYHYPVALRWLQEGTLRITSASNWRVSLPGNVEIFDLLILSAGRDRLLGVAQWPGLLALLLACLYLGRKIGGSAAAALPVLTTVLMIPIVANQSFSGYVDLFCAACLFASVALAFEYREQLRSGRRTARTALLVLSGLGCGLAVGAKPVYWLYGALVFCAVFLLLWTARDKDRGAWRRMAVFSAALAAPSIFWFIRAWACAGNPVYPFAVHLGPLSLPGVRPSDITDPSYYLANVRRSVEFFVYPWLEWKSNPGFLGANYTVDSGVGGAVATFVVPGLIFAAWLARSRRPALRAWFAAFAIAGALWWTSLQKVERFGLPLIILATLIAAPFFTALELEVSRVYRAVYVLVFALTACILVFEPLYAIAWTTRTHAWSRAAYYGYPPVIDALPPGSRVLSLCEPTMNFALAGSRLSNRVIPSWESPPRITPEFLSSHRVDYIIQKLATGADSSQAAADLAPAGLTLYADSDVTQGENRAEWRIYSTARTRDGSRSREGPGHAR